MAPANGGEDAGEVLHGPRQPTWSCNECGRNANWACRTKCRCGAAAPAGVLRRARASAAAPDGHQVQGPPRRSRGPQQGDPMQRQLDAMQKTIEKLVSSPVQRILPDTAAPESDKDKDNDKDKESK